MNLDRAHRGTGSDSMANVISTVTTSVKADRGATPNALQKWLSVSSGVSWAMDIVIGKSCGGASDPIWAALGSTGLRLIQPSAKPRSSCSSATLAPAFLFDHVVARYVESKRRGSSRSE